MLRLLYFDFRNVLNAGLLLLHWGTFTDMKDRRTFRVKCVFPSCSCQTKSKQTGRYFVSELLFLLQTLFFCFMCQKSGCKESSVETRRWQSSSACVWWHPNKHPARQPLSDRRWRRCSLLFGIRLFSLESTERVRPPAAWRCNWWHFQHERREENRFCQEHTASFLSITPALAFLLSLCGNCSLFSFSFLIFAGRRALTVSMFLSLLRLYSPVLLTFVCADMTRATPPKHLNTDFILASDFPLQLH